MGDEEMTDYFNMMKDVSSAYGRGQMQRRDMDYQDEERAYQKELRARDTETYNRQQGIDRANEDDLATIDNPNRGLYSVSAARPKQQVSGEGFGVESGGAPGMRMQDTAQSTAPNNVGAPLKAGLSRAEKAEVYGRVARRNKDMTGAGRFDDQAYALRTDDSRKDQYKTLRGMKDDDLANYIGGEFSKDGSGHDAMLVFDPKKKQFVFASKVPGFPTQTFSRAELENHAMGIWESGNGDIQAGIKSILDSVKAKRGLEDTNYNRAAALAAANAKNYWDGDASQDRKATQGITAAHYKSMEGKPNYVKLVDRKTGEASMVDASKLPNIGGVLQLPEGLTYPREPLDPSISKEYRAVLQELGPRPVAAKGMLGGVDDKAGQLWDAKKAHVDSVFGAAKEQTGGPVVAAPPRNAGGLVVPKPTPAAPDGPPALTAATAKILSAAGNGNYNVQLPNGRTQMMSRAQLEDIGYRFPR